MNAKGLREARGTMMHEWLLPCGSREAIVTIQPYTDEVISGYLQHTRLCGKVELQSLSRMILRPDGLLGLENYPNPPLSLVRWQFEAAILTVLDNIEKVYDKMSSEGRAEVAAQWDYVQSYRASIDAGNPDEGLELSRRARRYHQSYREGLEPDRIYRWFTGEF